MSVDMDDFDDLAEFDEPEQADPDNEIIDLDDPEPDEPETFEDELPAHIEESMADPEYAAAVSGNFNVEPIRHPLISGHCSAPQTVRPEESHARCKGYSRANPAKVFQPCPCLCHFPEERYECAGCGGTLMEAPHYPLDEDGDVRYVHLDTKKNRATDGECSR